MPCKEIEKSEGKLSDLVRDPSDMSCAGCEKPFRADETVWLWAVKDSGEDAWPSCYASDLYVTHRSQACVGKMMVKIF